MTATGSTSMNRLSQAVSPYLLAHAHQSVEWYPWGDEAFAEAARRDVPVMISIGYRTCHWCHVMSRESFDDRATAELLNEHVVSIKVDREEHLDVDATYLAQAAAFTQNLGWPLTIFATPEGRAFYAATYLPPVPREGLPSFSDVVNAASQAWRNNRAEVLQSSSALVEALAVASSTLQDTRHPEVTPEDLSAVVGYLRELEDPEHGGFGRAPKFPLAPLLNFLGGRGSLGDEHASTLARRVLDRYAHSDLFDSVEGGFFRYSTQADFSDPHYERMLYDNAGLLMAYSRQQMPNVAAKIVGFLSSQLAVGEGLGAAFASGQDSESTIEGVSSEGGYYRRDAKARALLEPPALDDKIVTGWNGQALEALAHAHRAGVEGNPGLLGARIASWLLDHHVRADGSLIRVSRNGVRSNAPATLEDYGSLALGLLELGMALGRADFVARGGALVERARVEEAERADPVLLSKGLAAEGLASGDISEGASPSGRSSMALALLRWSHLMSRPALREEALALVAPYISQALQQPLGLGGVLRVLSEYAAPARELVVVGEESELGDVARTWHPDGAVCLVLTPAQGAEFLAIGCDLVEGRLETPVPTAYLCERGVCALGVTDATALSDQLTQ